MRCTAGTGFGREGKIKRKRIGKTRQREDEGGNGGEKMKNEITKKVPKDGAKGQDKKPRMPILQGFPRFLYACWIYFFDGVLFMR